MQFLEIILNVLTLVAIIEFILLWVQIKKNKSDAVAITSPILFFTCSCTTVIYLIKEIFELNQNINQLNTMINAIIEIISAILLSAIVIYIFIILTRDLIHIKNVKKHPERFGTTPKSIYKKV